MPKLSYDDPLTQVSMVANAVKKPGRDSNHVP